MGLPARGKSTLTRRIEAGLTELGLRVSIFNNGDLRRRLLGIESAAPNFFAPNNHEARAQRRKIALLNMEHAREWLSAHGDIAIIDATHSTFEQRELVRNTMHGYPVVFLECVNNDQVLLNISMRKKTLLPEFGSLTPEQALESFRQRVEHYSSVYEPLTHEEETCWIRIDTFDNKVLDEKAYDGLPYYSAIRDMLAAPWVANLYLARHGETEFNVENRIGGNPVLTKKGLEQSSRLANHFKDIDINHIFSSDLLRTRLTSQAVLNIKPHAKYMPMPEFNEIHAGVCEGMSYNEVRKTMPQEYQARSNNKFYYKYPNGDSYADLRERVVIGLRRALFLSSGDNLMIIGHQATNRIILSLLLYRRDDDVPYIFIPQNQYYHISLSQRRKMFELIKY